MIRRHLSYTAFSTTLTDMIDHGHLSRPWALPT